MIPDAEKFSLLIVGAEAFTRNVFTSAAADTDCFAEPLLAEDAYDALAAIWDAWETTGLPDVVVADFDLPGLNAIQFVRELRRHAETRGVFVAILSSVASEMDRFAAETAGADFFAHYATLSDLGPIFREISGKSCRGSTVGLGDSDRAG
jgi:CheY-like chemotaxis protein